MDVRDLIGWGFIGLIWVAGIGGVVAPFVFLRDSRRRQSGHPMPLVTVMGAQMAAGFDQFFRPEAAQARHIWEVEKELPAPAPSPGDRPNVESGRITIVVPYQH